MKGLRLYSHKTIEKLVSKREGETRLGEKITFVENLEEITTNKAKFVLFGIPEDIGIRANHGKAGASTAWEACLNSLLNIQENEFTNAENILLLGEIDCKTEMQKAANIDVEDPNYYAKLGDLVEKVDEKVSLLVERIVSAGKTPIIIGGGHNNAFGNIKGTSKAIKKPLNILNIDAHTDLRKLEHRHSGNGFSFAQRDGFLGKYAIFGLHKNYTPQYIFNEIKSVSNIKFHLFEDLILQTHQGKMAAFNSQLEFINKQTFGLELDCDAIINFSSSAQSPSGFALNMVRNFLQLTSEEKNCKYLHICEAAPNSTNSVQVGKALSYFVTDFMGKTNN
ncbi:formiminoglutamase [Salegentibacter holothuriorum]|uniref:Formiminoglutamase n=1 Tax=Salegentibacter holothuriorum TaxID=241145 RepID=A0A1T5AZQ9_9FLAO|nr:formimidoylglutamase [Salegentibacter holothuriorum]SKB40454.1 formiminoglutamase [Salegentibacter holothuriorum]